MRSPSLERIRIDRTHIVGSIDPVNPVYIYKVEQIHAVDGIAEGDSNQPRSALGQARPQTGIRFVERRRLALCRPGPEQRHDIARQAFEILAPLPVLG